MIDKVEISPGVNRVVMLLRIPEDAKDGIKVIAKESDDFIFDLKEFLRSQEVPLDLESILEQFKKRFAAKLGEEISMSLFEVLVSLQTLIEDPEFRISDEEVLAKEIAYAVQEDDGFDFSEKDISVLQSRIISIYEQESCISLAHKAKIIKYDHDKIFGTGKIYTDIRPIFKQELDSSKGSPAGYSVIHNLKVSFEDVEGTKEFFVALDAFDLELLADEINRALQKEQILRDLMKSANIPSSDF
ncbi:MAG: hypothetical protein WBA86_11515 [Nodosilinea sp.]